MSTGSRFASSSPRSPGRAFFVPGVASGERREEQAYAHLRERVRADTQREPRARRIFSIDCRFGGRDCQFEVGQPDPVGGVPVLAIFDVGGEERYAVCLEEPGRAPLRLGRHVYAIDEFR